MLNPKTTQFHNYIKLCYTLTFSLLTAFNTVWNVQRHLCLHLDHSIFVGDFPTLHRLFPKQLWWESAIRKTR